MAHFAELDENNVVKQVIVVSNQDILDSNGNENEEVGVNFCKGLFGQNTIWKQTSYNNNFRCRYAGIGMIYNEEYDVFVPPSPYPSWVLNTEYYNWDSPIIEPTLTDEQRIDGYYHEWNEAEQTWDFKQREIS
jgi:hypothetical protein